MKHQRWSLISAVSILIAVPVLASADPVTFHYRIEVTQRCQDPDGFSRMCSPFNTTFPLMMTFDTAPQEPPFEEGTRKTVHYGSPTFSPVPLFLPPEDGPFIRRDNSVSFTRDSIYIPESESLWRRDVGASEVFRSRSYLEERDVFLYGLRDSLFRPTQDAFSMAELLGAGMEDSFFYGQTASSEVGGGNMSWMLMSYQGRVFLTEPSTPAPEPASFLLLGSGLFGLLGLRRRRN